MQTSNFASMKKIEAAGLIPISIAIGNPRWYDGQRLVSLAPTREMLRWPRREYDKAFRQILRETSAPDLLRQIEAIWSVDEIVLLCWEAPNVWCHRRLIAEWFELGCGIVVPEFGQERHMTFRYALMPGKRE